MNKNPIIAITFILLMTACNLGKQPDAERLRLENDSLRNAKIMIETEVNEYLVSLESIQVNIDEIKSRQNIISLRTVGDNVSADLRKSVTLDVKFMNDLIKENQDEILRLRKKLKSRNANLNQVDKTLMRLTNTLQNEQQKVKKLQNVIAQKDVQIEELANTVAQLGQDVEALNQENVNRQKTIIAQNKQLNRAWYAIGTKKELRANAILSNSGLFRADKVLQEKFNKDYFVSIDTRTQTEISLYTSSKPKILTNHQKDSYKLEKKEGNYVLKIVDVEVFWKASRYLVVEIR